MCKNYTTTQSRIETPKVTTSSKDKSSGITDWLQATSSITHHHQALNSLPGTPNNTHHHETSTSRLEIVRNNVLHSDIHLPNNKTNNSPNLSNHCQENYGIKIIVNNIAGLGISTGKMDNILQWLTTGKVDILLGQEANVSFRHPKIQSYFRGQQCAKIHITTSETEWIYQRPYKPGGTFCLSTQRNPVKINKKNP
jgi:hypothetical protein